MINGYLVLHLLYDLLMTKSNFKHALRLVLLKFGVGSCKIQTQNASPVAPVVYRRRFAVVLQSPRPYNIAGPGMDVP
jgi:hypothetical protein